MKITAVLPMLLATACLTQPAVAADSGAEPGLIEKTKQAAGEVWDSTREHAGKAADWTADKAEAGWDATKQGADKAWDATREGAGKAADWTGEKVEQGAEATSEGAAKVWDKTKEATGEALEWTGDKARDAADAIRDDETPREPAPVVKADPAI